ncbi:hypothetical protein T492DRAFT_1086216 [Pavlovales sp. CCMP2436]|nr:hypothetical protein T492DRAFT_1086216 [Pavlovales sp. CCMP2436]
MVGELGARTVTSGGLRAVSSGLPAGSAAARRGRRRRPWAVAEELTTPEAPPCPSGVRVVSSGLSGELAARVRGLRAGLRGARRRARRARKRLRGCKLAANAVSSGLRAGLRGVLVGELAARASGLRGWLGGCVPAVPVGGCSLGGGASCGPRGAS